MKAIQLEKPGSFRVIDIDEPPAPGPGEAVVRVHQVGICGTDLGGYLGKMPFFSYPRIPGHELGVEVMTVGDGVTNVSPGDRCSVEPYLNSQRCHACRRGHTNCCHHNQTLGVHCDGGLRRYYTVPARKYRHWGYDMGTDRLRVVRGYLFYRDTIVPFGRIQHIDVDQGPIDRRYGLAKLTVHTAGNHNSTVVLPGLAHTDALAMREAIRAAIRQDVL